MDSGVSPDSIEINQGKDRKFSIYWFLKWLSKYYLLDHKRRFLALSSCNFHTINIYGIK